MEKQRKREKNIFFLHISKFESNIESIYCKSIYVCRKTTACIFNEEFMPILKIMKVLGVQVGPKSMVYAQTYSDHPIMRAEEETSNASQLPRSSRRAEKTAENDV